MSIFGTFWHQIKIFWWKIILSNFLDPPCLTNNDGPQKNVSCIFPWIFKGKKYNGCTTDDDPDGNYWCSTKVDENLIHVNGQNQWGLCSRTCLSSAPTSGTDNLQILNSKFNIICKVRLKWHWKLLKPTFVFGYSALQIF